MIPSDYVSGLMNDEATSKYITNRPRRPRLKSRKLRRYSDVRESPFISSGILAGRSYPGINGTTGVPSRPLSLNVADVSHVRIHAADALRVAFEHGYSHAEVHIKVQGSTVAEIQAARNAPPAHARGLGAEFDTRGTVARIVFEGSDGVWVLDLPLSGPALPGARIETGQSEEGQQ